MARASEKSVKQGVNQSLLIALEKKDLATAEKLEGEYERYQLEERGRRGSQRPLLFYRGLFDLKRGRTAEAVSEFKEALRHVAQTWNIDAFEDCLANAYLEMGRFDEAIAEYERILKLNPNYQLVHYHLGQSYERKGQIDQARADYQRFLQVWKNAAADVPDVVTARNVLTH